MLKNKKKKTIRLFVVLGLVIMNIVCFCFVYNGQLLSTEEISNISRGTSADLINSVNAAQKYVEKKYEGKSNLIIRKGKNKIVNSINLSQTALNSWYNRKNGTSYNGTCTEVASTILTVMYANSENPNPNATFEDILDYAAKKGYFDVNDSGTYTSDIDKVLDYGLNLYKSSRHLKAKDDYWNVYNVIKQNSNNNKLIMFNIKDHSMVGAGYYEFNVTWKENTYFLWWKTGVKTVTKTEGFVVVNQGWFNANPGSVANENDIGRNKTYQLFPADKIGGNWFQSLFAYSDSFNVVIS